MTRANVVERPGASAGLALLGFKTLSCYGFAAVFAISLGACGGGGGGSEVAADTQGAASEPIEPATMDIAQAKPERLDASATGEPKSLLMKRSGNGDVFVVWYADNPERRNLWASRYDAATRKWGKAELIEVTDVQVGDFNLATDGRGNAFVLYQAGDQIAVVRYNAAAKSWSPTTSTYYFGTGTNIGGIAADSAGSAMVVFTGGKFSIFEISARYYDVTKGGWQPQVLAEQNFSGTGFSDSPIVVLNKNGDGNALWRYRRTGFSSIGGNSFTASTKQWDQIQDGGISVLGGIPGSGVCGGVGSLQLSADATGNFFV
ncbi:MAG TPA: hypothetical protein VFS42_07965, partial [Burkholderiaceae bacterium]|nr:hypothetical protein [Burkholderiaceae bacterium]